MKEQADQLDTGEKKAPVRRARSTTQKEARREQILASAAQLLRTTPYADFTLAQLAAEVGLVKGTLYLYFPTKEAVAIELLQYELQLWADELEATLGFAQESPAQGTTVLATARGVAHQISKSLATRPLLMELFAILHTQLEDRLSVAHLYTFKKEVASLLARLAESLESTLAPLLPHFKNEGQSFLLQAYALMIGGIHLTRRSPQAMEVIARPDMALYNLTLEDFLSGGLYQLLIARLTPAS